MVCGCVTYYWRVAQWMDRENNQFHMEWKSNEWEK